MTENTERKKPGPKPKPKDDDQGTETESHSDKLQESRTFPPPQPQPNLKIKGEQEFRHDLFKAEVASMKRNMSWKKGEVKIVSTEHCHFYHTVNSAGKPQTFTGTIGGHFHEVKWEMDAAGHLVAFCSKPFCHKYLKKPNGRIAKKMTEVKWMDGENEQYVVDDHVHKMTYVHSEYLSQSQVRQARDGSVAAAIEENRRQQAARDVGLQGA